MKAYISDITDMCSDIRIIKLKLPHNQKLGHISGQYIKIIPAGHFPRPYSIANSRTSKDIEIHIRQTNRNGVSDYLCRDIKAGDTLQIEGPLGGAIYRSTSDTPLLLLAGGTGISYAKAILEHALESKHEAPIHLIWGNDTREEFYLSTHFKALAKKHLNLRYIETTQRLDKKLDHYMDDYTGYNAYIAGPLEMIKACAHILKHKGCAPDNLISDGLK